MNNEDDGVESIEVTTGQRPVVRLSKESKTDKQNPLTPGEAEAASSSEKDDGDDSPLPLPSWLRKGVIDSSPTATAKENDSEATSGAADGDNSIGDGSDSASENVHAVETVSNVGVTHSEQLTSDEIYVDTDEQSVSMWGEGPELGSVPVFVPSLTSGQTMAAVGEWATKWNVEDDPYVTGLVAALGRRDNMTMWASLDPMELLPEPEVRSGSLVKRIARILTVIRNVLVFVPVALTWLSIQHATEAFGKFLREPGKAGQDISFLQFWQSPEGFLADHWRIQDIARLDAIIIVIIIAATLLANTLESRHRSVAANVGRGIQKERVRVGLMIAETLQGNKSASPESITESLALALNDLSQAARDVSLAAARMEAATVGIDSLNPQLENLNGKISDLDQRFAKDVVKSVDSLVASVSTLGVAMGGDMQKFVADVLAGLEEVNDGFKKTFVAVEFGTKQLRDDLDAIHRKLRS